jgi:hypothetical protein
MVWLAILIDPSVHPWPATIQHLHVVQARNEGSEELVQLRSTVKEFLF